MTRERVSAFGTGSMVQDLTSAYETIDRAQQTVKEMIRSLQVALEAIGIVRIEYAEWVDRNDRTFTYLQTSESRLAEGLVLLDQAKEENGEALRHLFYGLTALERGDQEEMVNSHPWD